MKKKLVLCITLACLLTSLVGCGDKKEAAASSVLEAAGEAEETKEAAEAEGKSLRGELATEETATEESEVKNNFDGPVLGGDNVEGYDGFAYLYEEILMTETKENADTGEKERQKLTVYIPDDEYATANGSYAYANAMGVDFRVELDPYIRYDAEDYFMTENLDEYLNNQYDPFYTTEYKDLVVSEAEEVGGENAVRATVEYCRYDKWNEKYYTVFATYYLTELESGETVLVTVEINDSTVTGKAVKLIEELEQFYQFDIDWDAERAEKKRTDYEASGGDNMYSTGTLMFELPEGWAEDDDVSDYETKVYAPEGDSSYAQCMITIYEEYLGYDEEVDLRALVEGGEEEEIRETFGDTISNYSAELCDTGLGQAAKIVYTITDGEDSATITNYVIASDYRVYTLVALETPDAVESAQIVLDGILATGQIKEY